MEYFSQSLMNSVRSFWEKYASTFL